MIRILCDTQAEIDRIERYPDELCVLIATTECLKYEDCNECRKKNLSVMLKEDYNDTNQIN